MKTEAQIREMLTAIRSATERGQVDVMLGTSQLMVLGWVLDLLPPEVEEFLEAVKDETNFRAGMAIQDITPRTVERLVQELR